MGDREFGTPEQVEAARRDLEGAETKDDVREVWRKHLMSVGHKRLGRLLLGRETERGKREK